MSDPYSPKPAPGERRHMTAFVCDLVGSVALAQRLDVEDYADLIRAFHDYVTQWVTSFNGYVFQYAGDAVWAYFGYPHAHEDDVHRAIRAALYVASAVESLDLHDEKLRAHIGIATGLCVVGDLHYKAGAVATSAASPADGRDGARGTTPNLAARLQTTAKPGEVLIADETRSLTGALFVFEERKLSKLDGIAEPVRAWRVIRESRERSRLRALRPATLSNLVGRDDELDRLSKLWNLASKQGNGQVIHLSGEPGIGKSRLVKAVADDPTGPDHIWWFHGAPHLQGSTFAPVIAHLEEVALKKDGPLPPVEKLRRRFPMLNTDALALLAPLLSIEYNPRASVQSMSPARRRERLFEILLGLVETECVHIPLLLVTEDLHWVDPSTLELLERLGTRASDLRLMVLMTSRLARENESGASHFHRMTLSQLARDDCHALLKSLWGDRELPAKTAHQIVDRTDGVPLYIEDVTHSVLRALSQEPLDASHHHVEAQQLTVPMGLRDHLMARIDQLGDAKRIAQAGAVVGREFTRPMIETLTTTASRELDAHLDRLTDSGLVEPSGTSPVTSFKFKHAMVRDAAYESVLKADRSVLHGRMAAWLEAERPELRMSQPEVIAHHYELAGAVEPAVTCWFEAGRRSVSRVGYVEAINHLKNAHRLLLVQPQSAARDRAPSWTSSLRLVPRTPAQVHSLVKIPVRLTNGHSSFVSYSTTRPKLFQCSPGRVLFKSCARTFRGHVRLRLNLSNLPKQKPIQREALSATVFWARHNFSRASLMRQSIRCKRLSAFMTRTRTVTAAIPSLTRSIIKRPRSAIWRSRRLLLVGLTPLWPCPKKV